MARINTPIYTAAQGDVYPGRTTEDPYDYAAYIQNLCIKKFADYEYMNELLALIRGQVALAQYRQSFACVAGLNVGDPVYPSASNTVAKADATSTAKNQAIGFCRYKPTTTTCYISHFYYASGLAGGTAGVACYLTDAGGFSATPGTIPTVVGEFISVTEALLFTNTASSARQDERYQVPTQLAYSLTIKAGFALVTGPDLQMQGTADLKIDGDLVVVG